MPVKLIAASVFALLLIFVSVTLGGWLVWRRIQAQRAVVFKNQNSRDVSDPHDVAPPARREVLSYWLEAFDAAEGEAQEGRRVASHGPLTLASGQQFKFHFITRERGYLYLIGPGAGNAPTMFLTARPSGGLKTNQATAGADFSFPNGAGQVLELDRTQGIEEYTVIFSSAPLLVPAFLAAGAGHELTPVELKELEELRGRAQTATPTGDVIELNESERALTVAVPAARAAAQPLIFEIRIEHH